VQYDDHKHASDKENKAVIIIARVHLEFMFFDIRLQEDCQVRFCSGLHSITAVCYGKRNVMAAQEPVFITTIIRWPGCCLLCGRRARCSISCVGFSAGKCTWEDSAKVTFLRQESSVLCRLVKQEIVQPKIMWNCPPIRFPRVTIVRRKRKLVIYKL